MATLSAPLQDCDDRGRGGSFPGGDHPDDNYSSATPLPRPVTLPEGARAEPSVGILQRGYAANAQALVESVGERTWPVSIYFDPVVTAQLFPVLLIPSGGLYGLENDAVFRARLEEYAHQGGTIVAFAQQHGYEYAALPGATILPPTGGKPEGGQGLSGYGWAEDISCFRASLYLSEWHPLLSGFDRAILDAHVDGYFTSVPTGTQVLLSRRVNGMPAAVLYPYPPATASPPRGGLRGGRGGTSSPPPSTTTGARSTARPAPMPARCCAIC